MRQSKAIDTAGNRALEAARRQFSAWRESRSHRGRIPKALWRCAVEQAAVHGVAHTARALRLNATELKKRMEERIQTPRGIHAPLFVELAPMPMSVCTVELVRGDGARMRVELPGPRRDELRAMTEAFLGDAR